MKTLQSLILSAGVGLGALAGPASAQPDMPSRVNIAFNRYYDYKELESLIKDLAQAYPEIVTLQNIGKSREGRDLWVVTVNDPSTGPDTSKPAMWIDGNIHGNEIQASEVVLYSLWYLTKAQGKNDHLTEMLKNYSFYFMVSVNPDGRQGWFDEPHTSSSSRASRRKVDSDRDGQADEDGPEDLNNDGSIGQMWMADPSGRFIRDRFDPRVFTRVPDGEKGEWTPLGEEGIDNDGDGRTNEDGPGGDDMNRNWPSGWLPDYAQGGAGPYPFESPETRAIGRFILDHPNIAAVQSYHNAGGMILRGPGASFRESFYPGEDVRVYDEIANAGALMLPYYRSMVIYRDLYTVHGGLVNWTAEGLGIISFTNELWTPSKYFQRDVADPDEAQTKLWRERMVFGQDFTDYSEVDHPRYGKVLVGGPNKWSSRNTPTFMLEEEAHRNFAFTMLHADSMPVVEFGRFEVSQAGTGVWSVTVEVRNNKIIPTRTGVARARSIGTNDLLTATPGEGVKVVSAGRVGSWQDRQFDLIRFEPERIQVREGIPGRGGRIFRYLVEGPTGGDLTLTFTAQKAKSATTTIELGPTGG